MTNTLAIQRISSAPRLNVVDDFLSDAEVEHVLRLAEHPESLALGLVPDRSEAGLSFEMPVGTDEVLTAIRARLAELLGFGNDMGATFRFRRYMPGEAHPRHTDAFAANGSELIVTALIGLVPPDVGGETEFPLAIEGPVSVPHRRARLVLWYNHTPDGEVDQQSAHAGAAVKAGEKTTLTAFVYKPTYYAASPFPAVAREPWQQGTPPRRIVFCHSGRDAAATRAWVNAAEWLGYTAELHDARGIEPLPDADMLFPVDFSPEVRRALTAQYRDGWTSVFTDAPQRCTDVALFLSRRGLPVRAPQAQPAALPEADRRWLAVVDEQCIGPSAPAGVRHIAVQAVRALRARTGVVEYVLDDQGTAAIVDVHAPAELSRIPSTWWAKYCLAVMERVAPDAQLTSR